MKRHILTGYLIFWLSLAASTKDKTAIRDKWLAVFNDSNRVTLAPLPVYESIANTNVAGWMLVVDERQLENLNVNLDNVTPAKFETWKTANMQNPANLRIYRAADWHAAVTNFNVRLRQPQATP